jgi:hypothetical protein
MAPALPDPPDYRAYRPFEPWYRRLFGQLVDWFFQRPRPAPTPPPDVQVTARSVEIYSCFGVMRRG